MAEKLRSHSVEITDKVQPIFIKVKTFGNFNFYHNVSGFHETSWTIFFFYFTPLGKTSEYGSINPSMSKSFYSGSQMIDGTSNRSLEAVLLNELNLKD